MLDISRRNKKTWNTENNGIQVFHPCWIHSLCYNFARTIWHYVFESVKSTG